MCAFFSRGKNKVQSPYTFKEMYLDYISDKDPDSIYYVSYSEYVDICSTFYKLISNTTRIYNSKLTDMASGSISKPTTCSAPRILEK